MTDAADRASIRALVDAYAIAVDRRDADRFRSLWEHDARLTVHDGDGPASSTYDGVDAIVGVIRAIARYRQTAHMVGAHTIVGGEAGDVEAIGETTCMAHHLVAGDTGSVDLVMAIRYVDRYRRDGDGTWRFATRECRKQWTMRYPVEWHWEPSR